MKKIILAIIALVAWASLAACTKNVPEVSEVPKEPSGNVQEAKPEATPGKPDADLSSEAEVLKDIVYAAVGGNKLLLDLYLPSGAASEARPLVIWIHGGGWQKGSRAAVEDKAGPLLAHGFAVASIDYRLTDEAKFPAQIRDCLAAVRFLRSKAAEYRLDPERFGVWGASAGGHLAALVGTAAGVAEFNRGPNAGVSARVQAVCDWFGPTDLPGLQAQMGSKPAFDHQAADSPEGKLVGGPLNTEPYRTRAREASPIRYIDASTPPFLIMHGDRDTTIPIAQSEGLQAALAKNGVASTFETVAGAGHGFELPPAERRALVDRVVAFFEKHLSP
jgi:acetyl esterase/lipase